MASFNRPNIFYSVLFKELIGDCITAVATVAREYGERACGIVYCHRRDTCETVATQLSTLGLRTAAYHAGMSNVDRETALRKWQSGDVAVMCATVAFGMGIDKADVRYVVHHDMPKSLEGTVLFQKGR